jgi:integrase
MSASHSTPDYTRRKPDPPCEGFPLFAHATGYWAKKIRGKLHYFGPWADWQAALDNYNAKKEDLHAGKTPRQGTDETTVKDVVNLFLASKDGRVRSGELSPRTYAYYETVCKLLTKHLGRLRLVSDLRPEDFAALRRKMTARWGLHGVATAIQYTRSVFKHAFEADAIDRPVKFGPDFARPDKKSFRLHRDAQGKKLFTAAEIKKLLGAANVQLKAMILLGINAAFGNTDCGRLTRDRIDLETGWVDYPRPKTGVGRRAWLWPETVEAVRQAIASRPTPKSPASSGLIFVTKYGTPWAKGCNDDPVSKEIAKLLRKVGIKGRKGRAFYALRHTFRTVADGAKDQPAVDHVMGHEVPHMSAVYRDESAITDERLQAVAMHVRTWLFAENKE